MWRLREVDSVGRLRLEHLDPLIDQYIAHYVVQASLRFQQFRGTHNPECRSTLHGHWFPIGSPGFATSLWGYFMNLIPVWANNTAFPAKVDRAAWLEVLLQERKAEFPPHLS